MLRRLLQFLTPGRKNTCILSPGCLVAACFLLLFTTAGIAQTSTTFRLASYNLLNYQDGDTAVKNPELRNIFPAINADLVVGLEMTSLSAALGLQNRVLNVNSVQYSMASFIDGPDTDPALYFKSAKFQFLTVTIIATALRNVNVYTLKYLPSGDTLRVLAVHLKASAGTVEEAARAAEVDSIRKFTNTLPTGSNFLVCGDFNIYSSTESAYQKLLAITPGNEGQFYDPLNLPGLWNQAGYAQWHTQSTRIRAFGGGSTGGMDDRFDFILYSKALRDSSGLGYVNSSFTPFGNDGLHYNDSINRTPNNAVGQSLANSLHLVSDHLPIYADFKLYTTPTAVTNQDAAAIQLLLPALSTCSITNKSIGIRVKNNSTDTIRFNQKSLALTIKILAPNNSTELYTASIGTGMLAPNATIDISVVNNYNFTQSSNYLISGWINQQTDTTAGNDSLAASQLIVPTSFTVTVSPQNATICSGDQLLLTASPANSWLWSTGATTQTISVNSSGIYTITATDNSGCSGSASTQINVVGSSTTTIFSENMGAATGTTAITTYEAANGFENDSLTMSGNCEIRITNASSGYSTASGSTNVFLTNTVGKYFNISGIKTLGYSQLKLSFGVYKSSITGTESDLEISYSVDGINYTLLTIPSLPPTGSGWFYRTINQVLPATSNLRLQFRQLGTTTQYRMDDLLLTGKITPVISSNSTTSFCNGDSLLLTVPSGQQYVWSTGATTASIYAKTAGNYWVNVNCIPSDTLLLSTTNCSLASLQLKVFLQGFYSGNNQMSPVLYTNNKSTDPTDVDSLEIILHSTVAPYTSVYSGSAVLKTNGLAVLSFPATLTGTSVYVAVKHRNSLETWSKLPVLLSTNCTFFFTP